MVTPVILPRNSHQVLAGVVIARAVQMVDSIPVGDWAVRLHPDLDVFPDVSGLLRAGMSRRPDHYVALIGEIPATFPIGGSRSSDRTHLAAATKAGLTHLGALAGGTYRTFIMSPASTSRTSACARSISTPRHGLSTSGASPPQSPPERSAIRTHRFVSCRRHELCSAYPTTSTGNTPAHNHASNTGTYPRGRLHSPSIPRERSDEL